MSNQLRPINSVQRGDVLAVVKRALSAALDADVLEDFVASIDWSGTDRERPEIADLLGQLEGWAAQYGDGDMTRAQYVGHLLNLLPSEEQERHFVLGGGPVVITKVALAAAASPALPQDQSSRRPQTGSGAPDQSVQVEAESDIFLAV